MFLCGYTVSLFNLLPRKLTHLLARYDSSQCECKQPIRRTSEYYSSHHSDRSGSRALGRDLHLHVSRTDLRSPDLNNAYRLHRLSDCVSGKLIRSG